MRPRELLIGFVLGVLVSAGLVAEHVAAAVPIEGGTAEDPADPRCWWVCG